MLLICQLLHLYTILIIARILMSYFPISPGSALANVYKLLYSATEPVLGPLRRVIPPLGMFDISPIVVIIVISLVCR